MTVPHLPQELGQGDAEGTPTDGFYFLSEGASFLTSN